MITITSQKEWDALPKSFSTFTRIEIRSDNSVIIQISNTPENSHVDARDNSHVDARDNSHVDARDHSHVVAWDNSHVEAWDNSHVFAWGKSHVVARDHSHVEAWDNSHVEAWDNSHVDARDHSRVDARDHSHVEACGKSHVEACGKSHVVARDHSHVEAWDNSYVEAWDNSHVDARDHSHVEAWDNSHVEACGKSHVVARDNSHVEAWDNSHVEAHGRTSISAQSDKATILLFDFSVVIASSSVKNITKKSTTSTIVEVPAPDFTVGGWIDRENISPANEHATVILFKRVSCDFKTQENTSNETLWTVGSTVEHKAWNPETEECGCGKFHACSRPYFCNEFRNNIGDRYIAIEIAEKDLFAWPKKPDYAHKIAFRCGTVLYECDCYGTKLGD